jgi:hypothetical protein
MYMRFSIFIRPSYTAAGNEGMQLQVNKRWI